MAEPNIILGFLVVAGALLAVIILLYWVIVCPALYRHGARFPTGLMPWRFLRDLRAYKTIIVSNGDFPFYYYLIWILTWTLVIVLFILGCVSWKHYNETTVSRRYAR